jgi:hypothetical protein
LPAGAAQGWPLIGQGVNGLAELIMDYLIIRRGLAPSYHDFLKEFAAEQQLAIVVDRRREDRRRARQPVEEERRQRDRRRPPPRTWKDGDFIVVKGREVAPPP